MKRIEDMYPRTSDEMPKEIEDAMSDYLKRMERIRRPDGWRGGRGWHLTKGAGSGLREIDGRDPLLILLDTSTSLIG